MGRVKGFAQTAADDGPVGLATGAGALTVAAAIAAALIVQVLAVAAPVRADPMAPAKAGCVSKAEKRAIKKGRTKSQVRRLTGTPGFRLSRNGRVEVRRYPLCGSGSWIRVKYKGKRVVSRRNVSGPTSGQPPAGSDSRIARGDADGNGTLDYYVDADGDGRYEVVLMDTDGNGRFESAFVDSGSSSGIFQDRNEDGYYEVVLMDANRDGRGEIIYYDGDGDRFPEWQCLDLVGADGVADTWVNTTQSSAATAQGRAANDLMTTHIVTMNQLGQLDPLSTGYIPYNPAPSLLRDQYNDSTPYW